MNDIEKRARELLAAEFSQAGREQFESGVVYVVTTTSAINAIVAALSPPEGYVLVGEKIFDSMREFVTGFHGMSRNNAENLAAEIVEELNASRAGVP